MTGRTGGLASHFYRAAAADPDPGPTDAELVDAFADRRDGDAFTALVRRHGPMVLGVCRRTLGNPHDADDAFQAAFLVLARRATTVPRGAVGNWLHGVAVRTARAARRAARRRWQVERTVDELPQPAVTPHDDLGDVRDLLDREVGRLPPRLRSAVVLCDLEGRTREDAARQLGVPVGTVSGRLTSARRALAARLARRGITLPAVALGATVPTSVAARTVELANGLPTDSVRLITYEVLRAMTLNKLTRVTGLVILAAGLMTGALAWTVAAPATDEPAERPVPTARTGRPDAAVALERKLNGTWVSGGLFPVVLTFRADGTFEQSALNETSGGKWSVRWDALPPTLALTYETAADPRLAGATRESRVVRLNDARLEFEDPDGLRPVGYTRARDAAGKPVQVPRVNDLAGVWTAENGVLGEFHRLELRDDGTFTLATRDEPLGTSTTTGRWENEGTRLVLRASEHRRDGQSVGRIERPTETFTVAKTGDRWALTSGGREFAKAGPKAGR